MFFTEIPFAILLSMAAYAICQVPPDKYPFAFAACAIALISGFLGQPRGPVCPLNRVKKFFTSLMNCAPLALMNIEIFLEAKPIYAAAHRYSIIPLGLDIMTSQFGDRFDAAICTILKFLNHFLNTGSLIAISILEKNYKYPFIALSYLMAQVSLTYGFCATRARNEQMYVICVAFFLFACTKIVGDKDYLDKEYCKVY
uniref:Uncharacterized protein n=1 Tax=Glossina austeni TaxID=7395 RepID=A0A1A9UHD6_GLOAU